MTNQRFSHKNDNTFEHHLELLAQKYTARSARDLERTLAKRIRDMQHGWERQMMNTIVHHTIHGITQQMAPTSSSSHNAGFNLNQLLDIIADSIGTAIDRL